MGFLSGKRILITGMVTSSSLSYGIARACHREGAELAFAYQEPRLEKRVVKLASEFGDPKCYACDVSDDGQIESLFSRVGEHWGVLDGFVHAIAYAPREAISGDVLEGLTRESFRISHEVSSYSFAAMAKAAFPMLRRDGASLLTLSYIGSVRSADGYNVMGMAKASLESSVRYLADALGKNNATVNAISAAPIRTLAASGLQKFDALVDNHYRKASIKREITIDDVGNTAAFLLSSSASAITGQVLYVDGGFSSRQ